jgi:cation transport ATPase
VDGGWPASLADTVATVLVTANALRLLKVRLPVGLPEGPR